MRTERETVQSVMAMCANNVDIVQLKKGGGMEKACEKFKKYFW